MDFFFRRSFLGKPVPEQLPNPMMPSSDVGSPYQQLIIAVAISGSNKSYNVLKWALKKFGSDQNAVFKLIYVHPKITSLPTPSGTTVNISEAPEDVVATYKLQVMQKTKDTLLKPFRKICDRKKVAVELQVLESNSVAVALTREVNQNSITNLVIGRSANGSFAWNPDITAKITKYVSNLCTVYVVSKGVYILSKDKSLLETEKNETNRDSGGERTDSSSCSSGSGPHSDAMSNALNSNSSAASNKGFERMPTIVREVFVRMDTTSSSESDETRRMSSNGAEEVSKINSPETSCIVSWDPEFRDTNERKDAMSSMSSNEHESVTRGGDYFIDNQETLKEITRLRTEIRHAQEMYAVAQVGNLDASRKINELKFKELTLKEHDTKGLEVKEKHTFEQKRREQRENAQRRVAEIKEIREAKEKEMLETASLVVPKLQYQEFTWEEITTATSSFSDDLKIGMGAYGAVYKCTLHHTIAAVKVLHSAESNLSKQFNQEIRHPHLVLLLGACPERGALVYEYMENGSLEDRLFQVNKSEPIP